MGDLQLQVRADGEIHLSVALFEMAGWNFHLR